MISKTFVAAFVVAGLASSSAMAAPKKTMDQRAATRSLNEQQLAMANNTAASPTTAPAMAAPATDPSMAAPAGQVAPPAGESMPMGAAAGPSGSPMTTPTEVAPPSVPPQ